MYIHLSSFMVGFIVLAQLSHSSNLYVFVSVCFYIVCFCYLASPPNSMFIYLICCVFNPHSFYYHINYQETKLFLPAIKSYVFEKQPLNAFVAFPTTNSLGMATGHWPWSIWTHLAQPDKSQQLLRSKKLGIP